VKNALLLLVAVGLLALPVAIDAASNSEFVDEGNRTVVTDEMLQAMSRDHALIIPEGSIEKALAR
jgi:hypothetical protein